MVEPMMNADPEHSPSFLQDSGTHGMAAAMLGRRWGCTDQVIGDILSGWRYDLSSVAPATHGDYEHHFVECFHCRARRRLHRTIDLVLMALFTLSFFAFLLATAVIHRAPWGQTSLASLHTRHLTFALTLQTAAMAGLLFSLLMWVLVAIATPAPQVIQTSIEQRRWATGRQRL